MGALVAGYLAGSIPLAEFKSKNDGLNKRNELWGFSGIKGQMFFNLLVNAAEDETEVDQELKAVLTDPVNELQQPIENFESYVKRIGEAVVKGGNSVHSRP